MTKLFLISFIPLQKMDGLRDLPQILQDVYADINIDNFAHDILAWFKDISLRDILDEVKLWFEGVEIWDIPQIVEAWFAEFDGQDLVNDGIGDDLMDYLALFFYPTWCQVPYCLQVAMMLLLWTSSEHSSELLSVYVSMALYYIVLNDFDFGLLHLPAAPRFLIAYVTAVYLWWCYMWVVVRADNEVIYVEVS